MSGRNGSKIDENTYYDVFHTIGEFSNDPGWKEIFEDAANGIFRDGFRYSDGKLIYQRRNKIVKHHINDDPEKALAGCMAFMSKRGIKTKMELEIEKQKQNEQKKKGWSSIRSESLKLHYIRKYLNMITAQYQLNDEDTANLKHLVAMSYLRKLITNSHIVFQNCHIVGIKDLHIEPGNIYME